MKKKIKNNILNSKKTIKDALKLLEFSFYKIIVIVNNNKQVVGTITDGDVRRAVIKNIDTNNKVSKIMNSKSIKVSQGTSNEEILKIMKMNVVKHVLIVDKNGKLDDIISFEDLLDTKEKDNPVFIMAGGIGRRLRPLTKEIPKPMALVGGKPLLDNIIRNFVNQGFKNFFISINYKKYAIKHYLNNKFDLKINIDFIEEKKPLGTIGSIALVKKRISYPALVINGDILTRLNFNTLFQFHLKHNPFLSIAVKNYELKNEFGVVKIKNNSVTELTEKPIYRSFINTGIYVLSKEAIELIKKKKIHDFPDLVKIGKNKKKQINAFIFSDYWIDIGKISDLKQAETDNLNIK